jgi:hypothetical protein
MQHLCAWYNDPAPLNGSRKDVTTTKENTKSWTRPASGIDRRAEQKNVYKKGECPTIDAQRKKSLTAPGSLDDMKEKMLKGHR